MALPYTRIMSSTGDSASPRSIPRVIAFLNQKGGVGKTTSTVNVGAAMAEAGQRVCLVDMDPQSHLSLHLGIDGDAVGETVYDLMIDPDISLDDVLVKVRPNLSCVPSRIDLAALESELVSESDRHQRLIQNFEPAFDDYDYILIDCPPSLGLLTLNALALAQEVVVPMQGHFLAMQGVGKLLETVGLVCQGVNPRLKVSGIILCMYEKQSSHVREVITELDDFFDEYRGSDTPWADAKVLRPAIRKNIKLAEAPSFGQTIFDYAPWCPGALDYRTLAERLIKEHQSADREHLTDEQVEALAAAEESARQEAEARAAREAEAKAAAKIESAARARAAKKAKAEARAKAKAKAEAEAAPEAPISPEPTAKANPKAKTKARPKTRSKAKASSTRTTVKGQTRTASKVGPDEGGTPQASAPIVEVEPDLKPKASAKAVAKAESTNATSARSAALRAKEAADQVQSAARRVADPAPDSIDAGSLSAEPRRASEPALDPTVGPGDEDGS